MDVLWSRGVDTPGRPGVAVEFPLFRAAGLKWSSATGKVVYMPTPNPAEFGEWVLE